MTCAFTHQTAKNYYRPSMGGKQTMPEEEEETIESLTEAVQGVMEILAAHALFLTSIVRALEDAGIEVDGLMVRKPPLN
jgi:hypothetical protein